MDRLIEAPLDADLDGLIETAIQQMRVRKPEFKLGYLTVVHSFAKLEDWDEEDHERDRYIKTTVILKRLGLWGEFEIALPEDLPKGDQT